MIFLERSVKQNQTIIFEKNMQPGLQKIVGVSASDMICRIASH